MRLVGIFWKDSGNCLPLMINGCHARRCAWAIGGAAAPSSDNPAATTKTHRTRPGCVRKDEPEVCATSSMRRGVLSSEVRFRWHAHGLPLASSTPSPLQLGGQAQVLSEPVSFDPTRTV